MSRLLREMHETAQDMHRLGLLSEEKMKELDNLYLPEVPEFSPEKIKKLREKCSMNQNSFAYLLNVSASTVQKWEIGNKKPSGAARKLLSVLSSKGLNALL